MTHWSVARSYIILVLDIHTLKVICLLSSVIAISTPILSLVLIVIDRSLRCSLSTHHSLSASITSSSKCSDTHEKWTHYAICLDVEPRSVWGIAPTTFVLIWVFDDSSTCSTDSTSRIGSIVLLLLLWIDDIWLRLLVWDLANSSWCLLTRLLRCIFLILLDVILTLILPLILKCLIIHIWECWTSWVFSNLVYQRLNKGIVILWGALHIEVLSLVSEESLGHWCKLIHLIAWSTRIGL